MFVYIFKGRFFNFLLLLLCRRNEYHIIHPHNHRVNINISTTVCISFSIFLLSIFCDSQTKYNFKIFWFCERNLTTFGAYICHLSITLHSVGEHESNRSTFSRFIKMAWFMILIDDQKRVSKHIKLIHHHVIWSDLFCSSSKKVDRFQTVHFPGR